MIALFIVVLGGLWTTMGGQSGEEDSDAPESENPLEKELTNMQDAQKKSDSGERNNHCVLFGFRFPGWRNVTSAPFKFRLEHN